MLHVLAVLGLHATLKSIHLSPSSSDYDARCENCLFFLKKTDKPNYRESFMMQLSKWVSVLVVEHRNMPVDDAVTLITRSFDKYMLDRRERTEGHGAGVGRSPTLPPPSDGKNFLKPSPRIQYLLNLLADHQHLSAPELSVIIEYLVERRRQMDPTSDTSTRSGL